MRKTTVFRRTPLSMFGVPASPATSATLATVTALAFLGLTPGPVQAAEIPSSVVEKASSCSAPTADIIVDDTVSALHPVVEADWLELLKNRVREADSMGLIEAKRREEEKRLRRHADSPVDMMLATAKEATVREELIFPARRFLQLPQAARSIVVSFSRTYVFIDAADKRQRKWLIDYLAERMANAAGSKAATSNADVQGLEKESAEENRAREMETIQSLSDLRIVITGGSLSVLARDLKPIVPGMRLWADQGGVLVRRLRINALPAVAALHSRPTWADVADLGDVDVSNAPDALNSQQGGSGNQVGFGESPAQRIRASEIVLSVRTEVLEEERDEMWKERNPETDSRPHLQPELSPHLSR